MAKKLKLLIACGGTGGHLFPGIACAEQLEARGHEVMLLISEKKVDAQASAKYGHFQFKTVPAIAKPKTLSLKMLPFLWKMFKARGVCVKILKEFGADAVLGMGGFTSLMPVYAASKMGLKTFVHDSNALPGKANVLTSRFCSQVFVGLSEAKTYFRHADTVTTGTPVRSEILHLPTREVAAANFGLDPNKKTLVVMGGSQGARRLNELSAEAMGHLPEGIQMLHIAGSADEARVRSIHAEDSRFRVLGFCDQMASAYAIADLVIARSGASSLTEISIAGVPSVLVPYPFAADDHQTKNAEVFAQAGAAKLVKESDLSAMQLATLAQQILCDSGEHERMVAATKRLAIPDAALRISEAIEKNFDS